MKNGKMERVMMEVGEVKVGGMVVVEKEAEGRKEVEEG
jgi:hypothetical protein